ncbi:hypothetical protein Dxin01_00731 [Deinococcus xinjiangensis]|uniref:OmpR/PhoB-type domain-containing protein n=1 Tax=Deinococcus xinjiangensis TaxID=457454 RepID=A0ABP9V6T6_9DEIO
MTTEQLERERQRKQAAWRQYVTQGSSALSLQNPPPASRDAAAIDADPVDADVVQSWQRSALSVPMERVCAPVISEQAAEQTFQDSPLGYAASGLLPELRHLAESGDLMIAIADPHAQLLWTAGSQRMHGLARGIGFVPGGCWDETSVGTNALGLALHKRDAVQVFAAEHYVMAVHDWVCYCSPIRDTHSSEILGVLNISTTWERHTPLGMTGTLHYVGRIQSNLSVRPPPGELQLNLCGKPRVTFAGETLRLTPRQHELLTVLALNPQGLTLDSLHAHLYGDQPISMSTLKAEVSTLRAHLQGRIASRPYRLTPQVQFDVQIIEQQLLAGNVNRVLELYDAPLLPGSSSPFVEYWREYLHGAVRAAVLGRRDTELLWAFASRFDDLECLELLEELLPCGDPRLPVVRSRRATLSADL